MSNEINTKAQKRPIGLLEKADQFFADKEKLSFTIGLIGTILFGLLLFEPKVSIGGDDSLYINRAFNFLNDGTFPTFQAPFYPIVITLILSVFGINLLVFKLFSFACIVGNYWFTYKLVRQYLSPFALFIFLFLIGCSSGLLSYASLTYSEAFYLFLQSIFLYLFNQKVLQNAEARTAISYQSGLIISFSLFILFLTRNVGLVAFLSVTLYFFINRNWRSLAVVVIMFAGMAGLYQLLRYVIWDVPVFQASGQGNTLLLKNSFQPELGNEDFAGFVWRLIGNSVYYLGFHLFNIFGLSSEENFLIDALIAIIIYLIFFTGFFTFARKQNFWHFIGIYILITIGVTFFVLQTYWNQERLIVTIAPIMLFFLIQTLYTRFGKYKMKKISWVFILFAFLLCSANLIRTVKKIPEQVFLISKYLEGDDLYGYPEDWQNYLSMARWTSENLPYDAFVACRKPGMAFIYGGGKNFYGIWKVTSDDPEVLYNQLKDAGVTHVILASLRTNPDNINSSLINTVRNFLGPINKAYPGKLELVHTTGENWPAYLYKLN